MRVSTILSQNKLFSPTDCVALWFSVFKVIELAANARTISAPGSTLQFCCPAWPLPALLCERAHPMLTLPVMWMPRFSDTTKVWLRPLWAHSSMVWHCTLFMQVSAAAALHLLPCPITKKKKTTQSETALYSLILFVSSSNVYYFL